VGSAEARDRACGCWLVVRLASGTKARAVVGQVPSTQTHRHQSRIIAATTVLALNLREYFKEGARMLQLSSSRSSGRRGRGTGLGKPDPPVARADWWQHPCCHSAAAEIDLVLANSWLVTHVYVLWDLHLPRRSPSPPKHTTLRRAVSVGPRERLQTRDGVRHSCRQKPQF
jgi:hypothetical protein